LFFHPQVNYGKLFAAGDGGGRIRIWETDTWNKIKVIEQQDDCILALKFSIDGRIFATGHGGTGISSSIHLWDSISFKHLEILQGHIAGIYGLDFSPDGKKLSSCSHDSDIFIWDINKKTFTKKFCGHSQTVFSVAFSKLDNFIVSGGYDGTIRVWNLENEKKYIISRAYAEVRSLRFSPDGKYLLSASEDGLIKMWNWLDLVNSEFSIDGFEIDTKKFIERNSYRRVCSVDINKHNIVAAGTADDGTLWLWPLQYGQIIFKKTKHFSFIWNVRFNPVTDMIATCGEEDGNIFIWDCNSSELIKNIKAED